ncbi:glycosyltransferase [Desulfobacter vibrioformis]|uniref:glycosyltransferase n=1 Tax=Desulfobacter vibrioformis TaxID=34031 RepID=UPI0005547FD9|nr:glycosyltransferase [Desulfobacter vibrioformis]
MKINFLNDGYRNCGGCLQLIKYANILANMGHEIFITYTHSFCFNLIEVRGKRIFSPELKPNEVPDCDAVLCSSWYMAGKLSALPASKGVKFAYLQDFENWSGTSEAIIKNWRQPVHLIAVARYLADAAMQHTSKKACLIPYGIDFDIFNSPVKAPPTQEIVIGGLYNSMPRKRFADLLEVVEEVRQKGCHAKLKLFGAAKRPDILPDHAEYIAYPSRMELRDMMRCCHVWLAMSDQEGLHIPPMEAMACGAVPICTNIGGMTDYCVDQVTGYQIDVGNINHAANRIIQLQENPKQWEAFSKAALEHIQGMGSEKENAAQMLDFFKENKGRKGHDALFDFCAINHNTHATLDEYIRCAGLHIENTDKDYAASLLKSAVNFYESQASITDNPNFFSRYQREYGQALTLLNKTGSRPELNNHDRPFRYAPNQLENLSNIAKSNGWKLKDTYINSAQFDGKLRIYLTLQCNLNCPYCVNANIKGIEKNHKIIPGEKWIKAINREMCHVVFTGGEPFLYKDLVKIINHIDPFLSISVYSNLSIDVRDQLADIDREVRFFVSWHARQMPGRDIFLNNIKTIQDNPLFSLTVHAVDAPENREFLTQDLAFFRNNGLNIDLDADQRNFPGCMQNNAQKAVCRRKIYLIDPEGTRYQCVSRLMRKTQPMENMLTHSLKENICLDICPDYGFCAPCDGLGETHIGILE